MPFFPKKFANPYNPSIIEDLPKTTEKSPKTAANIKKQYRIILPLSQIFSEDDSVYLFFQSIDCTNQSK